MEYVVFEKHLVDPLSRWKLHSKIIPDWVPAIAPVIRTFKKPDLLENKPSEEWLNKQKEKEKIQADEEDKPPQDDDDKGKQLASG